MYLLQYLFCDIAGALNKLPLGEAVWRSDLQRSSLLDQEDATMTQLLHSCLNLETDLDTRECGNSTENVLRNKICVNAYKNSSLLTILC